MYTILQLGSDLLLTIMRRLPRDDVISFLTSCRSLRRYFAEIVPEWIIYSNVINLRRILHPKTITDCRHKEYYKIRVFKARDPEIFNRFAQLVRRLRINGDDLTYRVLWRLMPNLIAIEFGHFPIASLIDIPKSVRIMEFDRVCHYIKIPDWIEELKIGNNYGFLKYPNSLRRMSITILKNISASIPASIQELNIRVDSHVVMAIVVIPTDFTNWTINCEYKIYDKESNRKLIIIGFIPIEI